MYQPSIHQAIKKCTHVMLDHLAVFGPVALDQVGDDRSDLIGAGTTPHDRFSSLVQLQSTFLIKEQASSGPSVGTNEHLGIECGPSR
jgi:hypothetical protein